MSEPTGPKCYIPRLERAMQDVPEKYLDFLWQVTGEGKAPATVQAAVMYVETEATQGEAAREYGINKVSVRKMTERLVDSGLVTLEEVRQNNDDRFHKFGKDRAGNRTKIDGQW